MKPILRVLILEDQPLDVELLCARLKAEGFDLQARIVAEGKEFEDALAESDFDLILSDYALPQFDGLTALRVAHERKPDTPFILVSGTLGEEQAVECLKAGATDYVLKQRLARLGPAIHRALDEAENRRKEKQAAATVRELSRRLLRLQDGERRRLAHELHETVAQNLVALSMNISFALDSLGNKSPKSKKILSDSRKMAEETLKTVQTISYLLHPPTLEALGLPGALRDYVARFMRRSGIETELTVAEDFGRMPAEVETALFRIAQEGLTNVERHSGSQSVRVELRRDDHHAVLEIEDAGRGIPPDRLDPTGLQHEKGVGIIGMREWLTQLGGRLEIQNANPGTQVKAVVPFETTEAEADPKSNGSRASRG